MRQVAVVACCVLLGCAQETSSPPDAAHPDFTGVWSGASTTQENELWELADLTACVVGCTPTARAYFTSLVEDPANDAASVQELSRRTNAFMRDELAKKSLPEGVALQTLSGEATDANFPCVPHGLARAALSPLPIEIRQDGANLTIAYQEWNQSRTIYLDGRTRPAREAPTPLGHSVGRYQGEALVVETTGVEPNRYYDLQSGGGHSAEAKFREHYVIAENPRRLQLELTITDPVTLLEPHVLHKAWLATPDVQLVEHRCGDEPALPEQSTIERLRQRL